ncbi:TetR/AcrR family transcriptional regulator [Plantactinospora sp. CA-290183]|uniref:TetR/AcrR family transcriptional regulator n=1 Tax=Plantactinospora sp. CA-290183 TaxID=3240006 RepID=UPI003D8B37C4
MTGSTGDTRSRIQAVALELFTEHGYEKTSLREIAERLGVTKAALYYHFKSKDDIVNSFVSDRIDRLDQLIAWAREQPADATGRRAMIRRYAAEFFGDDGQSVLRFFEQNQTVLRNLPSGKLMRERLLRMAEALAGPGTSPADQLRATLGLFAIHSSWFAIRGPGIDDEQRQRLALEIAYELLDRIDGTAAAGDAPVAGAGSGPADEGSAAD